MSQFASDRIGNLSVQQLQTFCIMYEKKSYAATARDLHLAIPTVWEQMKSLERTYETILFERSGRQMKTTQAADELFQIVEPLVVRLTSSIDYIASGEMEIPELITVAGGTRMLIEDFGESLKQFRSIYPDTRLRLISSDNERIQDLVHSGEADIAFMLEPSKDQKLASLDYIPSYEIDYLAVFPKRHRLAKKANLRLKDLLSEPLIVGHSKTVVRQRFEQALHQQSLLPQLRIAAETDNSAMTIAYAHSRLGIGIVGGHSHGPLMQSLAYKSLRKQLGTAQITSIVRKGRILPKALKDFKEIVSNTGASK